MFLNFHIEGASCGSRGICGCCNHHHPHPCLPLHVEVCSITHPWHHNHNLVFFSWKIIKYLCYTKEKLSQNMREENKLVFAQTKIPPGNFY